MGKSWPRRSPRVLAIGLAALVGCAHDCKFHDPSVHAVDSLPKNRVVPLDAVPPEEVDMGWFGLVLAALDELLK